MRLRSLLVPVVFGVVLLVMAFVTRSGYFARDNPGLPISSAMRDALGSPGLSEADEAIVEQRFPDAAETRSGLRYIIRKPGTGTVKPQRGQLVSVHYRGTLLDGTVFDDSRSRGEGPLNFVVGTGRVIPGWDEGIMDMTEGEQRTLIIPYWLAYGEKGIRGKIPARATLVFEVELLDIH